MLEEISSEAAGYRGKAPVFSRLGEFAAVQQEEFCGMPTSMSTLE